MLTALGRRGKDRNIIVKFLHRKDVKSPQVKIYSKNYLNTMLNIVHISTKIMRNKFNFFTRLLDGINTVNTPIMNMMRDYSHHEHDESI